MRMRPSDRSTDPTSRKSECSWVPVSRRLRGSFLNANDEVRERTSRPWTIVSWRMISSVRPSAKSLLFGVGAEIFQRQDGDRRRVGAAARATAVAARQTRAAAPRRRSRRAVRAGTARFR